MAKINKNVFKVIGPAFTKPELLLHMQIPKPLHGLNPRSIKGQEWWDTERKEAQKKNLFHCWACGVNKIDAKYHKLLEGHEMYKIDYELGTMEYVGTCSLCHCCHNFIHKGRMEALVSQGKMSRLKMENILNHGARILISNNLPSLPQFHTGYVASWSEWHLLFEGEKHYSLFASHDDWRRRYG